MRERSGRTGFWIMVCQPCARAAAAIVWCERGVVVTSTASTPSAAS